MNLDNEHVDPCYMRLLYIYYPISKVKLKTKQKTTLLKYMNLIDFTVKYQILQARCEEVGMPHSDFSLRKSCQPPLMHISRPARPCAAVRHRPQGWVLWHLVPAQNTLCLSLPCAFPTWPLSALCSFSWPKSTPPSCRKEETSLSPPCYGHGWYQCNERQTKKEKA